MGKDGYYSSGEFAKKGNVTKKTLRYYDEKNILKPSRLSEAGARLYSNEDLGRLQQILLLKFLGFSLGEIKEILVDTDRCHLIKSLEIQHKLVENRIEQLNLVSQSILNTAEQLRNHQEADWPEMYDIMNLSRMEAGLKNQYKNASNISARIQLHTRFSRNRQQWFPWIYEQLNMQEGMRVLETGCGDGSLWTDRKIPERTRITLTDISEGMVTEVRKRLGGGNSPLKAVDSPLKVDTSSLGDSGSSLEVGNRPVRDGGNHLKGGNSSLGVNSDPFEYYVCDCQQLPFADESFDLVVANHVLFYCSDIRKACREIHRVLKKGGTAVCGTYGEQHMKEISSLVREFDDRIVLSAERLYERFGKENGKAVLGEFFRGIEWKPYEDSLFVTDPEALIEYILSCHGNQNQYIIDCYDDFKSYVRRKCKNGFHVTKEAGIFIVYK